MGEDDIEVLRRKRMEEMKRGQKQKQEWLANGHGTYREIRDQQDFFDQVKASKRVVAAFYRSSTARCEIVDKHLSLLAQKHIETKFIKINAEKSPFLVERLKIWMIPTIVLIKDTHTEHSIVGFDEFGAVDDFDTDVVERVLHEHAMLLDSFM